MGVLSYCIAAIGARAWQAEKYKLNGLLNALTNPRPGKNKIKQSEEE
jgi:hypothetical protein